MINQVFEKLKNLHKGKFLKICFPEGNDIRILKASELLLKDGILKPVILGNPKEIEKLCKKEKINLSGAKIIEPNQNYPKYEMLENTMCEIRKNKNTKEEVQKLLSQTNYFGTMLLKTKEVDLLLGGATYSTADTVRPALQLIKAKPGSKIVSSCFVLLREKENKLEKIIFADCGLNLYPSSEQIVEIAEQSVETGKLFDIDPKVAFLSFSTKGSGNHESADKMIKACELLKQRKPKFEFDGELQFDAAYVEKVAKIKAPKSKVAGKANIFIFPDINAGNIGYKIAQRLGGFTALGPILQGLNAPLCDLSRGCSAKDIYKMAYITASQVKEN